MPSSLGIIRQGSLYDWDILKVSSIVSCDVMRAELKQPLKTATPFQIPATSIVSCNSLKGFWNSSHLPYIVICSDNGIACCGSAALLLRFTRIYLCKWIYMGLNYSASSFFVCSLNYDVNMTLMCSCVC